MLFSSFSLLCVLGLPSAMMVPTPMEMETRNEDCVPGSMWYPEDDCNACFCLDGGVAACTKNECHDTEPGMMDPRMAERGGATYLRPMPAMLEERNNTNCTQYEQWAEDCNLCKCIGDGMAVCTAHPCDESDGGAAGPKPKGQSKEAFSGEMCEVGDSWEIGCSQCTCTSPGQVVCAYTCNDQVSGGGRTRRQAQECEPGTTVQVACNTCHCMRDGRLACPRRACPPEAQQQKAERAGRDGDASTRCNNKRCPADCGVLTDDNGCVTACSCQDRPFFSSNQVAPSPSQFNRNPYWNPWNRPTPTRYWA